ncbi:hypothetical protein DPMN_095288 [Dreissena polymorpha]|uniref:Uncharacterized protein n=1 Tax=Dreissena polymorpha TaxID=45954 RepID=A0A9D4L675_DREPO|nr:hypothetical protein DPMN_095288 [Dreissena polymorpha]
MRSMSSSNLKLKIGLPPIDGNRGVVVMESLLHYRSKEKVEQDRREQKTLTDAH